MSDHLESSHDDNDFFIKQAVREAIMERIKKSGKIERLTKKIKSLINKEVTKEKSENTGHEDEENED